MYFRGALTDAEGFLHYVWMVYQLCLRRVVRDICNCSYLAFVHLNHPHKLCAWVLVVCLCVAQAALCCATTSRLCLLACCVDWIGLCTTVYRKLRVNGLLLLSMCFAFIDLCSSKCSEGLWRNFADSFYHFVSLYVPLLQIDRLDLRGVQLAALFMSGVDMALFANDACGQPIPWEHCCPWMYFDGKLLQSKLIRTHREKAQLIDVCDGQVTSCSPHTWSV